MTPALLTVTLVYQAFMLSDGALRMLVLLHLHGQGQTAWALALLLVPYELAGVVTNLVGGWLGARFGQKPALVLGLLLQVVACLMLTVDAARLTIGYVMVTQILSGVAKDFAKTAAKSYVRTLAPDAGAGSLFRVTSGLTGSKNATKGIGYFVGGALLASVGFTSTNLGLAGLLLLLLLGAVVLLPRTPGRRSARLRSLFAHEPAVNWLAAARLFLFGSRDAWFAIALPLFLTTAWGWSSSQVGGFLAIWVIGYGVVQALSPRITPTTQLRGGMRRAVACTFLLLVPLLATWGAVHFELGRAWLLVGLLLYAGVFAVCSSLHSWLVVALAGTDTTAERVGFYYAGNAAGRLFGLMASGWLFHRYADAAEGLAAALATSAVAVVLAGVMTLPTLRAMTRAAR